MFTFSYFHLIGYAQWQVDRSQDEVFLATQEAAGQHRDAQGKPQNKHHTEVIDKKFTVNSKYILYFFLYVFQFH